MEDGMSNKENQPKKKSFKEKKSPVVSKSSQAFWFSDLEFKSRQNLPADLPRRPTDIYLIASLITDQEQRLVRLLEEKKTVWLHSLGSSIPLAINLINSLREKFGCDKVTYKSWSHTWEGYSDNWDLCEGSSYISGLHTSITLSMASTPTMTEG